MVQMKGVFVFLILISAFLVVTAEKGSSQLQIFCNDGDERPCGTDKGACQKGVTSCIANQWSEDCQGAIKPIDEICANGKDDDCNGIVDDCPDATLELISYMLIGSGVVLFIFAVILSRIQAKQSGEEGI